MFPYNTGLSWDMAVPDPCSKAVTAVKKLFAVSSQIASLGFAQRYWRRGLQSLRLDPVLPHPKHMPGPLSYLLACALSLNQVLC